MTRRASNTCLAGPYAMVVGVHPQLDIAILSVLREPATNDSGTASPSVAWLPVAQQAPLPGQPVAALGYPMVGRCRLKVPKSALKAPGTKRLKLLVCDGLLSSFAYKVNLRRYTMGWSGLVNTVKDFASREVGQSEKGGGGGAGRWGKMLAVYPDHSSATASGAPAAAAAVTHMMHTSTVASGESGTARHMLLASS